jgi:alanyl-tRNA synthetase
MVKISVDLENREKLRRLHTTTHVVNHCARQVLGNHVWHNGSNLKPEFGTLDITHFNNLTLSEIFEIEKLANKTVFENKTVKVDELSRDKAEEKYGFTLYQGGAIPMKKLRVISVEDSDIEACGGIHMESTGGIGLIKIIETSKIQDGVVRLKYVVNEFALDAIYAAECLLKESCDVFSVDKSSIVRTSEKFFNDWKKQNKEMENLKKELGELRIASIETSSESEFEVLDMDMGSAMQIYTKVMSAKPKLVLKGSKFVIAPVGHDVPGAKKELNKGKFSVFII